MPSFDRITQTATTPAATWSNRDVLRFHYFNPNGAYARFMRSYDRLLAAVDNVHVMGGALLAYSGDYHTDAMQELIHRKRVRSFDATYHANRLEELAAKIDAFLEGKRVA